MQTRLYARLATAACFTLLTACVTSTTVDQVWHDQTRTTSPIGKTLVIVVAPRKDTSVALESEWVAQLGKRGVDASALHSVLPGESQVDQQRVVELVKSRGIDTVLISRWVEKKIAQQERSSMAPDPGLQSGSYADTYAAFQSNPTIDATASYSVDQEVAVVETKLYDGKTEKMFWSARSDTMLNDYIAQLMHDFVKLTIKEMAKTNTL